MIRGVYHVLKWAISFSLLLGRPWSYVGISYMLLEQGCYCPTDSNPIGVHTPK